MGRLEIDKLCLMTWTGVFWSRVEVVYGMLLERLVMIG